MERPATVLATLSTVAPAPAVPGVRVPAQRTVTDVPVPTVVVTPARVRVTVTLPVPAFTANTSDVVPSTGFPPATVTSTAPPPATSACERR